ncbi:DEAD/DEAH box helicase [Acinetobacter sp.]|uniref:DEAD/DEAH box helicase n=1 Tax=Acinetobacter sp. TaxID=472 RepID=UPI0037511A74
MNIKITRLDGGLRVSPAPPYVTKYLKYTHRSMETIRYKQVASYTERLLHTTDEEGGVYTLQGFFAHLCKLIHKNHDTFIVEDSRTPMPQIDWNAVKAIGLRDYQVDPVIEGLTKGMTDSGVWRAAGGFGKTYCQAINWAAWNSLNTILAIPLKQVFNQTYKKFIELFPDKHIGRVGGGHNDISTDITLTTFKSLPKCAIEKCELMLIDEMQGCTGDVIQEVLTSIRPRRIFGFTATDENLFSGADKVLTGLFGERLIDIPYHEALEANAVVPGLVYFVETPDVVVTSSTFEGCLVQGVKKCKPRNQLIAKICTLIPEKWQTLIFVDHIQDHLVELYKVMPLGTKFIHRGASKKELGTYALSAKQQDQIINDFTNGLFKNLIGTDAFRAGVDIPQLRVVIQASSGSSEIEVIQEALRGSRTLSEERRAALGVDEKTHFVLIDFLDNHDERLAAMAQKRMVYYRKQGWKVKQVVKPEEIDWYDYENKI